MVVFLVSSKIGSVRFCGTFFKVLIEFAESEKQLFRVMAFLENRDAMLPVTFFVKEIGSIVRNYLRRITLEFVLGQGAMVI